MNNAFLQALKMSGYGLIGIFSVIAIFYLLIKLLLKLFPGK